MSNMRERWASDDDWFEINAPLDPEIERQQKHIDDFFNELCEALPYRIGADSEVYTEDGVTRWVLEYGSMDEWTEADAELALELLETHLDKNGIKAYTFKRSEFLDELLKRIYDKDGRTYSLDAIIAQFGEGKNDDDL